MATASIDRVLEHTADDVNRRIRERTLRNIQYVKEHPDSLRERLNELEREWDIERALALTSSAFSLFGLAMGFRGRPRWFFLPFIVQAFYLQHTLQGWCPPLPLFRRLGFRTVAEIEQERGSLRLMLAGGTTQHGNRW